MCILPDLHLGSLQAEIGICLLDWGSLRFYIILKGAVIEKRLEKAALTNGEWYVDGMWQCSDFEISTLSFPSHRWLAHPANSSRNKLGIPASGMTYKEMRGWQRLQLFMTVCCYLCSQCFLWLGTNDTGWMQSVCVQPRSIDNCCDHSFLQMHVIPDADSCRWYSKGVLIASVMCLEASVD